MGNATQHQDRGGENTKKDLKRAVRSEQCRAHFRGWGQYEEAREGQHIAQNGGPRVVVALAPAQQQVEPLLTCATVRPATNMPIMIPFTQYSSRNSICNYIQMLT